MLDSLTLLYSLLADVVDSGLGAATAPPLVLDHWDAVVQKAEQDGVALTPGLQASRASASYAALYVLALELLQAQWRAKTRPGYGAPIAT